jgi:hypothetical protein
MNVHVDGAGQDMEACGIKRLARGAERSGRGDGGDRLAADADVGAVRLLVRGDGSAGDGKFEGLCH